MATPNTTRLLAALAHELINSGSTPATLTGPDLIRPSRLTRALALKATIAAAAGIGLVAGGGSAAWAGLQHQARLAAKRIGVADVPPPARDGFYLPDGSFRAGLNSPVSMTTRSLSAAPITLAMLGDSTMAGYGAATEEDLPGVMLARQIAASIARPVHLQTRAVVGSGAAGLAAQVQATLLDRPDLAVISVGANDVRDRVSATVSVAELAAAVSALRDAGISVVVGTCPDLGVIAPIPQPLRQLAGHWSRTLASKQEQAMLKLGVACIPIGRVVSPEFLHHPDFFSADLFHPSGAGYARAVAALMPAVLQVLAERDLQEPGTGSVTEGGVQIAPEMPSASTISATS